MFPLPPPAAFHHMWHVEYQHSSKQQLGLLKGIVLSYLYAGSNLQGCLKVVYLMQYAIYCQYDMVRSHSLQSVQSDPEIE